MQFWDELEGKSLAGTYHLHRWLRSEGNAAWFTTRYQEKPAIAYVVEVAGESDPVIASLEAVSRVQHSNIVQIERAGRAAIEGKSVAYAIQEPTEDNLSEALKERPLTTAETTQIAESMVGALGALHAAGLLHGQVKPTTVLAVGDTVKLRSDCVRKVASAEKDKPSAYAQDVGDLGALLFECLTQRRLEASDDPAIAKLPAPFAAIVRNTSAGRWGLQDVEVALSKPVAEAVPAAAAPPRAVPAAAPAAAPTAAKSAPAVFADEAPAKKSGGVRIVAWVAILVVLGALWYFFRGPGAKSAAGSGASNATAGAPAAGDTSAAPSSSAPEAANVPATTAAPAPQATTPADDASPAPAAAAPISALAATPASAGHKVWRVVVYTYGDQARAQQRVAIIQSAHPDLKPEVFTANGHGPYLVTIGGPMDHDAAMQARSHARTEGMAHDAYVQNYTH